MEKYPVDSETSPSLLQNNFVHKLIPFVYQQIFAMFAKL